MNKQPSLGSANGARVEKQDGDVWTLVLVRELKHAPAKVWEAITDPAQLAQWAPFDADRNLASSGTVTLTTVGAPQPHVTQNKVKRAEAPRLLEHTWGEHAMRWELEPLGKGTRLTLWAQINRQYIAWGAAGWHLCFEVLDALLAGEPVGRSVGPAAMQVDGFQRLIGEYTKQFKEA
jgi:uncharacterized protein YndB with AHSA1/START domain